MTSGGFDGGVMVSTLILNLRDVGGFDSCYRPTISDVHHVSLVANYTAGSLTVVYPTCGCRYVSTVCMCVIESITRLTI